MKTNVMKKILIYIAKWLGLSLLTGGICGLLGTLFSAAIIGATALRSNQPWLIWLLPIAGILSVGLYRLCKVEGIGTVRVMKSAVRERRVSSLLAPAIFGGTVLTHLFGGSAGKEGAALQLGGSIASFFGKWFRLSEEDQHILVCAGMGAFFSALFGTPLGAFFFALEVLRIGRRCLKAVYPALVASLIAFAVAALCGIHWDRFSFESPALDWAVLGKGILVIAAASLAVWLFCSALHWGERLLEKFLPNPYLRIAAGGCALILLTYAVGSYDYNGGGMQIVEAVFEGQVRPEAFALKMLFTVITVSAGFKGGEIVPSLFIGATLGGVLAGILGLPMGFAAALGMIAFLGGATNCPLAVALIALEMFGGCGWPYLAFAALLGYALTYRISLYSYPNNKKTEG